MKTILTIFEPTPGDAMAAIRGAPASVDGFELRIDSFGDGAIRGIDLAGFRRLSGKEMILTRRSRERCEPLDEPLLRRGLEAGFDWVDVELRDDIAWIAPHRDRVLLSHHDFEKTPDLDPLLESLRQWGTGRVKLAVTPRSFDDNLRILDALFFQLSATRATHPLTLLGMGTRGLYSRILAPFFGSELQFVARDDDALAAPGQLTAERAGLIYGGAPLARPKTLFAVLGNPASHSLSPVLHNARFREANASAAYAIAEVGEASEVLAAFAKGRRFAPVGLSITAPFKEEAHRFALEIGAEIEPKAQRCNAVNTLVRFGERFVAANTDVDAFSLVLSRVCGRDRKSVALLGAGGTARAALVALADTRLPATLFNRSARKGEDLAREFGQRAAPLAELRGFDGEIIVNTIPAAAVVEIPDSLLRAGRTLIDVNYGADSPLQRRAREAGMDVIEGLEILEAQAVRQGEMFLVAARRALAGSW